MKTYKNLYSKYLTEDNCVLALWNGTKNKSTPAKRRRAFRLRQNRDQVVPEILEYARVENFHNDPHVPVQIYDGISRKIRYIIVPTDREQVVHHMIVNVLKPILLPKFYEHSYGSIPGRGAHKAKKMIQKWVKHDKKNMKYCLKMDIKKYFDNVNHIVLKRMFDRIILDDKFKQVLFKIIDVVPGNKGIPLGFYTSQWIANWYLTGLDKYIKQELGAVHYVRYMDDMVIFASNKRELHRMRQKISKYLKEELDLELKDNWQVFRFDYVVHEWTWSEKTGNVYKRKHRGRFLDFMGFQFYRDCTVLRRSIMLKCTRKANRMSKKICPTIYDCRQMLSYLGWIDATDTYYMYLKYVKPKVSFRWCKRRVSSYDKAHNDSKIRNDILYKTFFDRSIPLIGTAKIEESLSAIAAA